jgi:hypothetical protein
MFQLTLWLSGIIKYLTHGTIWFPEKINKENFWKELMQVGNNTYLHFVDRVLVNSETETCAVLQVTSISGGSEIIRH